MRSAATVGRLFSAEPLISLSARRNRIGRFTWAARRESVVVGLARLFRAYPIGAGSTYVAAQVPQVGTVPDVPLPLFGMPPYTSSTRFPLRSSPAWSRPSGAPVPVLMKSSQPYSPVSAFSAFLLLRRSEKYTV